MEAKFRGKRIDNGEWVRDSENIIRRKDWNGKTGWTKRAFLLDGYSCNEMPKIENFVEVHPDSVGMWTGLVDKKGVEIYEGDIMKFETEDDSVKIGQVLYWPNHMSFVLADHKERNIGKMRSSWSINEKIRELNDGGIKGEIIGNTTDDPELLKES